MNRAGRRAYAFRKRTKEEIKKGIYPERVMIKGTQDSSEATHKQVFVKYNKYSRAGVKYEKYSVQVVPINNSLIKRIFA